MTLVPGLTPGMDGRPQDKAAREGLEPERYVMRTVEERLDRAGDGDVPRLPWTEAELSQHISEGLPEETWQEYYDLVAKRCAKTLTPEQHRSLIGLSEQIEMDYAGRLESVLALARLRGTSLEKQMQALSIPRYSYE